MKGKKKIKRRKSSTRLYFNKETQLHIELYQKTDCEKERNEIYTKNICKAFDKLAENLIFVYGFLGPQDNYLCLKSDCVSFLFETIHKWNPERGTKAFSYFNVVAKNWLIINCRQHKKQRNRYVSIDDPYGMSASQKAQFETHSVMSTPADIIIKRQQKNQILKLLDEMRVKLTNENELICLQAIETLFKSLNDLDLLNKRAVLIYIREISGLDKKQMSKAMSVIRRHYRKMIASGDNYHIFF